MDDSTSVVVLDMNTGAWIHPSDPNPQPADLTRRCRHAVAAVGPFVFMYGGLRGSLLLDDLLVADDTNLGFGSLETGIFDPESESWREWRESALSR